VKIRPICFVIMPFGTKKDPGGGSEIDFDGIYEQSIRPAVEGSGMDPIRADEERTGGIIHKPMYERLMLCDFAVADLTTGNANVLYELGVRHAVRPQTTLAIYDQRRSPPFDLNLLRCLPYDGRDLPRLLENLQRRLSGIRDVAYQDNAVDSPIFQLLTEYGPPDIARLKTDVFRDRVRYETEIKRALAAARRSGEAGEVAKIESSLRRFDAVEAGILVDLLLSYRAVGAWMQMISLYERLPQHLKNTTLMREQYGFALNRAGRRYEALDELEAVLRERGSSSETSGLIGRVYKDLWLEAAAAGDQIKAAGCLDQAIAAYTRGFEADWRDAYAGINAITLLEIRGDTDALVRKGELAPVVRFAVKQRLKSSKPDYWDYATLLEIAVLENDETEANRQLANAVAAMREPWEPETTANNLCLIQRARRDRDITQPWLEGTISALQGAKVRL
jgi:tetratricopeptide (TPR) repeat protein